MLKASGADEIYIYFVKYNTIHESLYVKVKGMRIDSNIQDDWPYQGITCLITKGNPVIGSDFRPITCMLNPYQLTTKCVT